MMFTEALNNDNLIKINVLRGVCIMDIKKWIEYQNKILDTLDNALNDLSSEDFDILIQRIQEYIDDLN